MIIPKFINFSGITVIQKIFLIIIINVIILNIFPIQNLLNDYLYTIKSISVLKSNDNIFINTKSFNIINIFGIDDKTSHSNYKIVNDLWNDNFTANIIKYMNTSTTFSITNIYFNESPNIKIQIICTYCTTYHFISNKQFHLINLFGIPSKYKNIFGNISSVSDFCKKNHFILESEKCLKFKLIKNNNNNIERNGNFQYNIKNGNISINCSKLIKNDEEYIENASKEFLKFRENSLNMNCFEIYKRGFGNVTDRSFIEKKYSLAYARNVYQSYEIVELVLLAQYSKNNHYCYTVDSKFPDLLKKMRQLEGCLPNVYVSMKQYDFQSNGKFTSIGHFECMKLLLNKKWNYIFLLQMDDIVIKTNQQILEILEAMNFPLDMAFTNETNLIKKRVNYTYSWTYKSLNIFLKGDKRRKNKTINDKEIVFYKGLVPCGMKYESIKYLVNNINITTYLNQLNSDLYGHDELTWQTLLTDDILNIPGSVSRKCVLKYHPRPTYLTRKVIWAGRDCETGMRHHLVCTWNVKLLKNISLYGEFHGYRFRSDQDFGALKCWANYMYQKNNFIKHENLNLWYYYNLPQSIVEKKIKDNNYNSINSCNL